METGLQPCVEAVSESRVRQGLVGFLSVEPTQTRQGALSALLKTQQQNAQQQVGVKIAFALDIALFSGYLEDAFAVQEACQQARKFDILGGHYGYSFLDRLRLKGLSSHKNELFALRGQHRLSDPTSAKRASCFKPCLNNTLKPYPGRDDCDRKISTVKLRKAKGRILMKSFYLAIHAITPLTPTNPLDSKPEKKHDASLFH